MAGCFDSAPGPTQIRLEPRRLTVQRQIDESGYLIVPWEVPGVGRLMGSTATLMERPDPYHFQIELARGKVNQLRCQAADWRMVGLQVESDLDEQIREASKLFGRAVTNLPGDTAEQFA